MPPSRTVATSLVFEKAEGNVGEPLLAQLVISSRAHPSASEPLALSEVKLVFDGCLGPLKIQAVRDATASEAAEPAATRSSLETVLFHEPVSMTSQPLNSPTGGLTMLAGTADLTVGPSQTKVFNLQCIPREAGEARVASVTVLIENESFDLSYATTEPVADELSFWWQNTAKGLLPRRVGKGRDTSKCKIRPKPPKIRITTPGLRDHYYSNERVHLRIGMHNGEDEAADVSLEVRLFGGGADAATNIQWLDEASGTSETANAEESEPLRFLKRPVGTIACSAEKELVLVLSDTGDALEHELEISAVYSLVSDAQTRIVKTVAIELPFIRPFEANYELLPRLHPQPWPDFFHVSDEMLAADDNSVATQKPCGLQQSWCLNTKVVSFAREPLHIEKMSVAILGLDGDAVCKAGPELTVAAAATLGAASSALLMPGELRESNFILEIQSLDLGERQTASLYLALEVQWRRTDENLAMRADAVPSLSTITTSVLAMPRFSIPLSEPRVLASALTAAPSLPGFIQLDYTVENPSMHFLTFSLTMEASDQFAFSGPKTMAVQLSPLSRHTVRYNLLASKRGLWIQPQLVVVDTYFNKTLRVLPTADLRSDKKGILVWVDADD